MLPAALFLLAGATDIASAGTFRIAPTLADVAPGATVATFTLTNSGSDRLSVQVDALEWTQGEAGESRLPSGDVIVVPRITTLAPGATQLVRVALRGERSHERAFRVQFRELPKADPEGFMGVRTLLHVDVPLFFAASRGVAAVDWAVVRDADGSLSLRASNTSDRFLQAAGMQLVDARGAVLARGPSPLYVLAGQSMQWSFDTTADTAAGEAVQLRFDRRGERQEVPLTLEPR